MTTPVLRHLTDKFEMIPWYYDDEQLETSMATVIQRAARKKYAAQKEATPRSEAYAPSSAAPPPGPASPSLPPSPPLSARVHLPPLPS